VIKSKNTFPEPVRKILSIIFITLMMCACCPCNRSNIRFSPPTSKSFALLEISGNYREIGYAIGSMFKREIQLIFSKRNRWFQRIRAYAEQDPDNLAQHLLIHTETHYPHLVDELRGMANGAEIPFSNLFLLNIHAEISARMTALTETENPGCSTIYWDSDNEKQLFHNEDGHEAYQGLMFMVKATLPSGVSVLTLTYPGFLMGNGPALNNHGVFQTTNFISSKECRIGIPRYFLGRAALEAKSLEEAITIVTRPERAFAYHHNLGSMSEKRIYSVEVTPDSYQIIEPAHLYIHTNHLLLDRTRNFPQNREYVLTSSMSRYKVISESLKNFPHARKIIITKIPDILSSHEQSPYSPCRHPRGPVKGITLATAVIDLTKSTISIYRGNPCHSFGNQNLTEYSLEDLND
jgi:predicted choloylglycine hydrolase